MTRRIYSLRARFASALGVWILASAALAEVYPGERPLRLVRDMAPGELRDSLSQCAEGPFERTAFSIGHRGAPLGFPEHTLESYIAAAEQGAGLLECDVTFTRDGELVCRHDQCDLHSTTDILATPLAAKCSEPFSPAVFDATGKLVAPASARCCTSDITLAEFRILRGRHDSVDTRATDVEGFLQDGDRPEPGPRFGTLMTHAESIELFRELGVDMIPELKAPAVEFPFAGLSRETYAARLVEEYKKAGVGAFRVRPQSFDLEDVLFWLREYPEFGRRAIYLDNRYGARAFDPGDPASWVPSMESLRAGGVRTIAPPLWVLLTLEGDRIVPSAYALAAREAGLDLVTWTLERPGDLSDGGGWYYRSVAPVIDRDGDTLEVLHVLATDVGVEGVFSDWPGTVTYYANCMAQADLR